MILRRLVAASVATVLVVVLEGLCVAARAPASSRRGDQDLRPSPGAPSPEATPLPPVSLERIRRGLEREPAIRLPEPQGPVFSVNIEGRLPAFADFVGDEALSRGAAPSTSLTHREYLAMVTPQEARSFGAFTPSELVQVAATTAALTLGSQWLVRGIKDAIRSRREEQARREVQAVLAELQRREREKEKAQEKDKP